MSAGEPFHVPDSPPQPCFLVACFCVRDEADILDACLAFHLAQGVDLVLVLDHGSTDGTRDVLDVYASHGRVAYTTVDDPQLRQGEWMTQMARAAAALGAAWVINADADEFWMPRVGSLQEVFRAIPDSVDLVHAFHQDFLPDPGADGFTGKQAVWDTGVGDGFYTQTSKPKVAHRASPTAMINDGNHSVLGLGRSNPLGWLPIDILHFPVRSYAQLERKVLTHIEAWKHMPPPPHIQRLFDVSASGRLPEYYSRVVSAGEIDAGLAAGRLVTDRRLAELLGGLRRGGVGPTSLGGYAVVPPAEHEPPPALTREVQLSERVKVIRDKQVRLGIKAVDETVRRLSDARQDGAHVARRVREFLRGRVSGAPDRTGPKAEERAGGET